MIDIENITKTEIDNKKLVNIIESMTDRDIDILLCNDKYIHKLNKEYRGVDRATDVLSFPLESNFENMPLGSLVISIDRAIEKANELGHNLNDEIALLAIHGILHLLGMDHETDNGQMREAEKEWIEYFNLPESLIIRTQKE